MTPPFCPVLRDGLSSRAFPPGGSSGIIARMENSSKLTVAGGLADGLVMFALADYIGEDKVNLALRNFLEKNRYATGPFPDTRGLVAALREQTPPELGADQPPPLAPRFTLPYTSMSCMGL